MFQFCAAQAALFEVAKYIPLVATKAGVSELHVYHEFQLLPIEGCQPTEYEVCESQATVLIGSRDGRDVPTLALALARNLGIWSNDNDFQGLAGVQVFTTAQLLRLLAKT
jgi:predicted nucleic acid-binding protein